MVNTPAIGCLRTDGTAMPVTDAETIFTATNDFTAAAAGCGDWSDAMDPMMV